MGHLLGGCSGVGCRAALLNRLGWCPWWRDGVTAGVLKLIVLHGVLGRGRHGSGILFGVLGTLGQVGVEVENLENGLGVSLNIFLGDGGRVEQPGPFLWKARKLAGLRVEADVDGMGKVGGIAHTAWAAGVDAVDPCIQVIVTLDANPKRPHSILVIAGRARVRVAQVPLDLEDRIAIVVLHSANTDNIRKLNLVKLFPVLVLVEIQDVLAQDEVSLFPLLEWVLAW